MPASDSLQDMKMLLTAQQEKKPKKRKFTYAMKKPNKGEGFLASGFKTANPG